MRSVPFSGRKRVAVQVKAYRPTSWWGVPTEDWRDDAACDGLPSELFELGDQDDITEDEQHEVIAQGLKICATCPVRQACGVNSSELDRYWTTRGGQPPEGLFPDSLRPRPSQPKTGGLGGGERRGTKKHSTCRNGHRDWKIRADGRGRYCNTCRREQDSKRDRSKRAPRNRHPKGGTI